MPGKKKKAQKKRVPTKAIHARIKKRVGSYVKSLREMKERIKRLEKIQKKLENLSKKRRKHDRPGKRPR